MPPRPETELHSLFSFDSESSFKIVRTDGEANEAILNVVKKADIDPEKGPHEAMKVATQVIEDAIQEGKVPAQDKERLIKGARQSYYLLLT